MRNFYRVLSLAVFAVTTLAAWAAVPFKTTSIVDGKFAANTTWYTMQIGTSQHIISDNAGASKISLTKVLTDMSDADLWCFVGDDTNGYKIYNKQAGPTKVLAAPTTMSGTTGANSYPVLKEKDNLPSGYTSVWRFMDSSSLGSTDVAYAYMYEDGLVANKVNNRDGRLAFWTGGQDAGSTLRVLYVSSTTGIDYVKYNSASDAVYDLQGRKLEEAQNGIYIIDGEKKLVK